MTHRRYSRTRTALHKRMARNPGGRKPQWMRLEQSARDRGLLREPLPQAKDLKKSVEKIVEEKAETPLKKPGFLQKLFKRREI